MSVKDLNKVIIISSALTGRVLLTVDYDDYVILNSCNTFVAEKIFQLLDCEEGAIVKVGSKG